MYSTKHAAFHLTIVWIKVHECTTYISERVSDWDLLRNVTCNDISVIYIYVTTHRCASRLKTKCDLWWRWIGCLMSQLTIFQSYMWRHLDVQADWRRSLTYGRAPNARHFVGFLTMFHINPNYNVLCIVFSSLPIFICMCHLIIV